MRFASIVHREGFIGATDDEAFFRIDLLAYVLEPAFKFGRTTSSDLDVPGFAVSRQLENKIDFGTGGGAEERGTTPFRQACDDVPNHESLPTRAHQRIAEKLFHVPDAAARHRAAHSPISANFGLWQKSIDSFAKNSGISSF